MQLWTEIRRRVLTEQLSKRQAAALGTPQATQVADRWHLLHNLHDALVRMLEAHDHP